MHEKNQIIYCTSSGTKGTAADLCRATVAEQTVSDKAKNLVNIAKMVTDENGKSLAVTISIMRSLLILTLTTVDWGATGFLLQT
jgi:hypothetical protein